MKLSLPLITFLTLPLFHHTLTAQQRADSMPPRKSAYRATAPRMADLVHTRLDVRFNWDRSEMEGKASITAKPYFKSSSTLTLDARGMDVKSVEVYDLGKTKTDINSTNPEILGSNKLASSFKYERDSLKISLGREFRADEKYVVKIAYTARPNTLKKGGSDAISDDKGLYFINPKGEEKNKMPQIWTQGETQANSAWFPTIDSPNEKMTSEIYMTVDEKYTTLSNGALADSKKNTDGTRTDHWKMDLPHSPYLVMMGVGEFKKVTDKPWNGKEVSYYVEKEYEPYAKNIFGNTPEMIDFFSKVLGTPYPWAKYSQIVVRDYVSGAMENTSATLHGDFMVYQTDREMLDGKKGEDVISHELFHQWFGDLVTCESWSNLPLNESFATYGEYLWQEYKNGRDAADAHSFSSRQGYFAEAENKQVNLVRYHYENREDMFDAFSYNKGGQVLHMLRKAVGDAAFFASLKLYLEKNRFKSAEIHNLRLAFEEVTGEDLNWFFNEWFLDKGHPELEISKSYDAQAGKVKLTVVQKQDLKECPLYVLPIDVDIYYTGKKERQRILITDQQQEFFFNCPVTPDLVNFDAERQLLGRKTYTKTETEHLALYYKAGLYNDRYEALSALRQSAGSEDAWKLMADAAENDKWEELRIFAIRNLMQWKKTKEADIRSTLLRIAANDRNPGVKAAAVGVLGYNFSGPDLDELFERLLSEQSYELASSALTAMSHKQPQKALEKAKTLEGEKNEKLFAAVAGVYSNEGSDANLGYFTRSRDNFSAFGYFTYIRYYGEFLKRCSQPKSFEQAADDYLAVYSVGNSYVKEYVKSAYKEAIVNALDAKIAQLSKAGGNEAGVKEFEAVKKSAEAKLAAL